MPFPASRSNPSMSRRRQATPHARTIVLGAQDVAVVEVDMAGGRVAETSSSSSESFTFAAKSSRSAERGEEVVVVRRDDGLGVQQRQDPLPVARVTLRPATPARKTSISPCWISRSITSALPWW